MISLGIDIGTTSICVVCYDADKDKIIKSMQGSNEFMETGSFLQNPETIIGTARKLLLKMLQWLSEQQAQAKQEMQLTGIGISSQMHGILYVNHEGRAVSPLYTWKNEYGKKSFREGKTYAEYFSEKTGCICYSGYGSVTHFYLKENHEIPVDAVNFVGIGDYLAMVLTGRKQGETDATMAAGFGGFSLRKRQFDFEKLQAAGVDISYYPKISGEPIAGSCQGIFVCHAIGDNQASFLGAVRDREKTVSINAGTGSQVSVYGKELYPVKGVEVRPFMETGYLYVGASLNGGKVYERLGVFLAEICERFTGQTVDIYRKMEELAETRQQTDLITVPSLYGTRGRDDRGAGIFNLTHENFHGADLIRSFAAGMAKELYDLYQLFPEELKKGKTKIAASGNGIRKNRLLQEEIKKLFQQSVAFTEREEEAAAGAAWYAWQKTEKRGTGCRL